jgi:hypothetical protein
VRNTCATCLYPGASHAALANAANSNLMPVLGNYMAYKIPDGTTLIDPATGKLNSDAKLLYADNYDEINIQLSVASKVSVLVSPTAHSIFCKSGNTGVTVSSSSLQADVKRQNINTINCK